MEQRRRKQLYEIEDDLSVDEAIFLIEWGYDADEIKQGFKKKAEG